MVFAMRKHPRPLTLHRRVSMTTYSIPPTVLYIKQHSVTKLKYFGRTTRDPLKYKGSGVHWLRHIKKHDRKHIVTLWVSEPYTDADTIMAVALAFSKDHNIVESKDWANQRPENGLDGAPTGPNGRKGIPTGQIAWNKGKPHPSWNKGKPSPRKGIPNGKKGISTGPSPKKGIPTGPQRNPAPKVECPHCGLVGRGGTMNRWHFDNCKMNIINQ